MKLNFENSFNNTPLLTINFNKNIIEISISANLIPVLREELPKIE